MKTVHKLALITFVGWLIWYLLCLMSALRHISVLGHHILPLVKDDNWLLKAGVMEPKIPPIIHHVSPSLDIPAQWLKSYRSCRDMEHHKTYQFYLWTDQSMRELIYEHYDWFLDTYDNYPYQIQRVDAARYFILHRYGGIYLDLDVGCRISLDWLRYQGYGALFPMTSHIGVSNDVMCASKGHPVTEFIIKRLELYNKNWIFMYPTVMFSTGPGFLSMALVEYAELNKSYSHSTASSEHLRISADDVRVIGQDTYTKTSFFHVFGSSWHGIDAKFVIFIYENQKWIAAAVLVLLLGAVCGRKRRRSLHDSRSWNERNQSYKKQSENQQLARSNAVV